MRFGIKYSLYKYLILKQYLEEMIKIYSSLFRKVLTCILEINLEKCKETINNLNNLTIMKKI